MTAEYFHGHKFILNITDVLFKTDRSKLKTIKEECESKGFFKNKKNIIWNNINTIGIISKQDTQGYNDFIKQFKIPIDISLEEISLEGKDTAMHCIKAIRKLQNLDLIIIIRGGGTTSEISNSFDVLELFESIRNSKIPIITAIGHEFDKGDKLLITQVSDYDYPTPSTAAYEINNIKLLPVSQLIKNRLTDIKDLIDDIIENDTIKLYNKLDCYFKIISSIKFGGPIIQIKNNEEFIIIENEGKYYKNIINYDNKIDITTDDIVIYKKIESAINSYSFNIIQENIKKITIENKVLAENINETINNIKSIIKLEHNIDTNKPKSIKSLYCKKFDFNKLKINKLIQLYSIHLWYLNILEENIESNHINNIYNFFII